MVMQWNAFELFYGWTVYSCVCFHIIDLRTPNVCKKRFDFKSNMTQRHKHVHGEGRQFECDFYNKSFTILCDLERHK